MVLRLVGAALLSLCGVLSASALNRRAERRLREVESWILLLRYVKGQVECFSLPMNEILARCEREILQNCGYVGTVAPKSFLALLDASSLHDADAAKTVRAFAEEFGRGYREEQTRGCDYYLSLLEARRRTLAEKLPAQKKLNSTLCLCAALAIVLLLL